LEAIESNDQAWNEKMKEEARKLKQALEMSNEQELHEALIAQAQKEEANMAKVALEISALERSLMETESSLTESNLAKSQLEADLASLRDTVETLTNNEEVNMASLADAEAESSGLKEELTLTLTLTLTLIGGRIERSKRRARCLGSPVRDVSVPLSRENV